MNKKRNWRAIFTWILLGFAVAYALPSAVDMPSWWPFHKQIRGGLDLAGGLELRYTVDWKQTIEDTTRKGAESLQSRIVEELVKKDGKNVADLPKELLADYKKKVVVTTEDIDRAKVTLADDATWAVYDEMDDPMKAIDERFEASESSSERSISLLLPDDVAQKIRAQVVTETRDNLEKRVGGMGLIDPDVRVTGDSDVAVQVPGVSDPSQMDVVRSVLGRTAQLTMRFVDRGEAWLVSPDVVKKLEEFKQANPTAAGMEAVAHAWGGVVKAKNKSDLARFVRTLTVPANHMIGFNYDEVDKNGDRIIDEKYWQAVYLFSKVELTGQHLARARMSYNQEGKPAVYLDMNGEGAELFAEATGNNVKEYLAIMLDEDVQSAPIINQKIGGGRAEISMGAGGKRAFQVVDLSRLRVVVQLPEKDLARVSVGQPVELAGAYDESATASGQVQRISPVVDAATGTVRVTVAVDEPPEAVAHTIRPGQFVKVRIEVDRHDDVLTIPRRGLVWEDGEPIAWTVVDAPPEEKKDEEKEDEPDEPAFFAKLFGGDEAKADAAKEPEKDPWEGIPRRAARRVKVDVGYSDPHNVEVDAGLVEGDQVVVIGNNNLREDSLIRLPGDPAPKKEEPDEDKGSGDEGED